MKLAQLCLWWGLLPLIRSEKCGESTEGDSLWARIQPAGQCEGEEDACPYQIVLPPLSIQLPREFKDLEGMTREMLRLKETIRQLRRCCQESTPLIGDQQQPQQPGATEGERDRETNANSTDTGEHAQGTGVTRSKTGPRKTSPRKTSGDELDPFPDEKTHNIKRDMELRPTSTLRRGEESRVKTPPVKGSYVGDKTGLKQAKPVKVKTAWDPSVGRSQKGIKVSEVTPQRMDTDVIKPAPLPTEQSRTPEELNPFTITRPVNNTSKERKESHDISYLTDAVPIKTNNDAEVTALNINNVVDSGSESNTSSSVIVQNVDRSAVNEPGFPRGTGRGSSNAEEDLRPLTSHNLPNSSEGTPEVLSVRTANRNDTELKTGNPLTLNETDRKDKIKDLDPKEQMKINSGMKKSTSLITHLSGNINREKELNKETREKITNANSRTIANASSSKYREGEDSSPVTMESEKNGKTANPLTSNRHDVGRSANPADNGKGRDSLNPNRQVQNLPPSEEAAKADTVLKDLNVPPEIKVVLFSISNVSLSTVSGSALPKSVDNNIELKTTQAPINSSASRGEEREILANSSLSKTQGAGSERQITEALNKTLNQDQKTILGNINSSDKENKLVLDRSKNITQLSSLNTLNFKQMKYNTSGKKINQMNVGRMMNGNLSAEINQGEDDAETITGDVKHINLSDVTVTGRERQKNPISTDNEKTDIKLTELDPEAVQVDLKTGGIKQPISQREDTTNNTKGPKKSQHPAEKGSSRDKASNPSSSTVGGKHLTTSVHKGRKETHFMNREQPTKRPITQDRPVDSGKASIKPHLGRDTEGKSNTSSDNINKTNIMKTSNSQAMDKSVDSNGERKVNPNPDTGNGGEKQSLFSPVDQGKENNHLINRGQPWRTKRPTDQEKPVDSTKTWLKPLLSTDTDRKPNASLEDNINKNNVIKTGHFQTVNSSISIANRTTKAVPTIRGTTGEKQMNPISTDNGKTSIRLTELIPGAVQTKKTDDIRHPISHGEENNNDKGQKKPQHLSDDRTRVSNKDKASNPLTSTGVKQSTSPPVDKGREETHFVNREQQWRTKRPVDQGRSVNSTKAWIKPHLRPDMEKAANTSSGDNINKTNVMKTSHFQTGHTENKTTEPVPKATGGDKQMNPVSKGNKSTGVKVAELKPVALLIDQMVNGTTQLIDDRENINNTKKQNNPQYTSGNTAEVGNRNETSKPHTGTAGEKQSSSAPNEKDERDSQIMNRGQPWRTKRPIDQDKPVDKLLLSTYTRKNSNTSSRDNKTNIMKTYNFLIAESSVGIVNTSKTLSPKATSGERHFNPVSTDNEKTGIKVAELNPVAVEIDQMTDGMEQPIPPTEENINNSQGQKKPQYSSDNRPQVSNRNKTSKTLIGTDGGKQSNTPPVDQGKKDSHLMNRERPWKTKRPIDQDRPVGSTKAWLKPHLSRDTKTKSNTSSVDTINKNNVTMSNFKTMNTSVGTSGEKQMNPVSADNKGTGIRVTELNPVAVQTDQKTDGKTQPSTEDNTDNTKGQQNPQHPSGNKGEGPNPGTGIGGGKQSLFSPVDQGKKDSHLVNHEQPWRTKRPTDQAMQMVKNTDKITPTVPSTEDDINNRGQKKPQHSSDNRPEVGNRNETSKPLIANDGGKQLNTPPINQGKKDSHLMSREQPRTANSKNAQGLNQLEATGQSDNVSTLKKEIKSFGLDELSEHLSEDNTQDTERNLTTPISVEGTGAIASVVQEKGPGIEDVLRSKSLGKQSYRLSENKTDTERVTNNTNTSMRHKVNITSGLKKLLPFNMNKNQTRQSNIMKHESNVSNSKKRKQDLVPVGKVTKGGESHTSPDSNNNSQQMKPPEYVEETKYTDEVRGSKSLTVEGIQGNYPETESHNGTAKPAQDCSDYMARESRKNGIFIVRPDLRNSSFPVLCEMESYGGGWTLLQRRYDGSISFNRSWNEYKKGFGQLDGEFWLGNDKIHLLTKGKEMVLRIQLEDIEGLQAYATYEHFSVASERERYRLTVGQYSGTAGDALNFSQSFNHDQKFFTTPDRDNDQYPSGNCGAYYGSGWWFDSCMSANLNGKYYHTQYRGVRNGIYWGTWPNISSEYYPTNYRHAFKTVSMLIRPSSYKP